MQLKSATIHKFRNFQDTKIEFNSADDSQNFALASPNGGGKSTLLQIIFILLHCYQNKKKKKYITQILDSEDINQGFVLADFNINIENTDYLLQFKVLEDSNEYDFSIYTSRDIVSLELEGIQGNIEESINEIVNLKERLIRAPRLDSLSKRTISNLLNNSILDKTEYFKLTSSVERGDIKEAVSILDTLLLNKKHTAQRFISLSDELYQIKREIEILEARLKDNNLKYVLQLRDGYSLVVESIIPDELSQRIEGNIYLSAPSSQVFSFLEAKEREKILTLRNNENNNQSDFYIQSVEHAKGELEGFFTFDFTTTDMISNSFEKAFREDKASKIHSGSYGDNYDKVVNELNHFLEGKKISQDVNTGDITFKLADTDKQLKPEDLSHGELKKLSLYSWIKHIVQNGSIVLIDELDIALHPKWQETILCDLGKWQPDNQYVVATHSPQILNSIHYKNIRFLETVKSGTVVKINNEAPLDRDTNSMIEAMGSNSFPRALLELHRKYRRLVKSAEHETPEGIKTREEILEFESKDSLFLQDIQYDIDLIEE